MTHGLHHCAAAAAIVITAGHPPTNPIGTIISWRNSDKCLAMLVLIPVQPAGLHVLLIA